MKLITTIQERNIFYAEYDTAKNWIAGFPDENWCLLLIADEKRETYFDEIIRKSIDRNVGYICAAGSQYDYIHDLADEIITYRDVEGKYLPKHLIMTIGHKDIEEALWFAAYTAENPEEKIKNVILMDVTRTLSMEIIL